jgi:hypothetical protein
MDNLYIFHKQDQRNYLILNEDFNLHWIYHCDQHTLLQIVIFLIGNFDQKIPLLDTSKKPHLNHFGQDQFDLWSFLLVKWWAIWLIKSANKIFGKHYFWVYFFIF